MTCAHSPLVHANWLPRLDRSRRWSHYCLCGVSVEHQGRGPSCLGPFGACVHAQSERLTLFAWSRARYMALAKCPNYGLAIKRLSSPGPDPAWLRWPRRQLALILLAVALDTPTFRYYYYLGFHVSSCALSTPSSPHLPLQLVPWGCSKLRYNKSEISTTTTSGSRYGIAFSPVHLFLSRQS